MPHPPQLLGSLTVSTQLVPHFERPIGHEVEHSPDEHTCGSGHAVEHLPQFFASPARSTHLPVQTENPAGHATHFPAMQSAAFPHWTPHPPQLSLSAMKLTHFPLQSALPGAQDGESIVD